MINSLRGMKDIIEDSEKFCFIVETASKISTKYGFTFIETPIVEETSLYNRSVGESSDIVGKEMYQFMDKGGNNISLRPEGTAGVVRAFIQKKLDKQGGLNRFFYTGPMFRYERPQKGRFRQFHQFGIESFGCESVYEDALVIIMIKEIFEALKIDFTLELNSLGCTTCMPTYRETLKQFLENKQDKICDDCKNRTTTNPIRTLDCKNSSCQDEYTDGPKITDNLCPNCNSDFDLLKDLLSDQNINFKINKNLVRGLDYYNKTAFEFVSTNIGSQNAIAGGGRYDKLVETLGGKSTPAVGFAIGIERIFDLVELTNSNKNGVYFGSLDDEHIKDLFKLSSKFRSNTKVICEYQKKSLKNHLKNADKMNLRYCCVIGSQEKIDNKIWIKDLEKQIENIVDIDNINSYIG